MRAIVLGVCVLLAPACVSTELETPASHPANSSLAGPRSEHEVAVLREGFDPFERYEPAGSDAAREPAEHEDHSGHAGHGTSAPEPSEPSAPEPITPEPSAGGPSEASVPEPSGPSATEPSAPEPSRPSKPKSSSAAPAATSYTCPMHPEIVRTGPGRCPKCGMKLVPKKAGRK